MSIFFLAISNSDLTLFLQKINNNLLIRFSFIFAKLKLVFLDFDFPIFKFLLNFIVLEILYLINWLVKIFSHEWFL